MHAPLRNWFAGLFNNSAEKAQSAGQEDGAQRELMPERLERLGFDAGYIADTQPDLFGHLERTCARCEDAGICAADMDRGDVQTGMARYCLNQATIDALVIERNARSGPVSAPD